MAASKFSWLSFSLGLLLLCGVSEETQTGRCRIDSLEALEPSRRVESEAGVTEYYDENSDQLQCAGVSVMRERIEPNGLLLPSYSNSPRLVYILQGRGITGVVIPGCPESYQQSGGQRFGGREGDEQEEEEEERGQSFQDEHQKIQHFRQGDVLVLPAGVAHWCYNDGRSPVTAVTVFDTSNSANQLDATHRQFLLAGRKQQGQRGSSRTSRRGEESSGDNVFSGFDVELLAEAIGVSRETARKLQSQDDNRGHIVRVERGLEVLRPRPSRREEEEEEEEGGKMAAVNGLDEAICSMKMRENIGEPSKADLYIPGGGRLTVLNNQKLPILSLVHLSANRGVLQRNAILAPHWNINAHAVVFVTSGRGRLQIVSNQGKSAFDGELRQGQLIVVPQNFAVLAQARSDGFSWISFQTNENAMNSAVVGKTSALRGIPVDVLVNSYRISREEAKSLKFNRGQEMAIFSPRSSKERGF